MRMWFTLHCTFPDPTWSVVITARRYCRQCAVCLYTSLPAFFNVPTCPMQLRFSLHCTFPDPTWRLIIKPFCPQRAVCLYAFLRSDLKHSRSQSESMFCHEMLLFLQLSLYLVGSSTTLTVHCIHLQYLVGSIDSKDCNNLSMFWSYTICSLYMGSKRCRSKWPWIVLLLRQYSLRAIFPGEELTGGRITSLRDY